MGQLQAMLAPHEGTVNWDLAKDTARRVVGAEPDPTPSSAATSEIADALRLADHWLDSATDFPSGDRDDGGLEPGGLDRADAPGLAADGRADRRARRRRDGAGDPRGGQGHGRPVPGADEPGGRRHVRHPGRPGARRARCRGADVHRHRSAARPRGQGGPAADQRRRVPRGARRPGRGRAPLPRAARGGAPAAVRPRPLAARARAGSRRGVRPGHQHRHLQDRVRDAEIDPTNPAALQDALEGGLFEPEKTPAQQAALTRLETDPGPHRGLGGRGRPAGDPGPDAVGTQARRGDPPAAGRGRAGGGHLRRARRAGAAPAPAAGRGGPVGRVPVPAATCPPATRSGATPT